MTSTQTIRWTIADLDLFPDDGRRYEIIDGELFVTRSPHWKHQTTTTKIVSALNVWSQETGLGEAAISPGLIFSESDSVIPDVVWVSKERLGSLLDKSGHLIAAPELVIEVLSPGEKNERRDKEIKLKLYSSYGVFEYWIVDNQKRKLEIYRREQGILKLALTLYEKDERTSPMLPNFKVIVSNFF